MWILVLVVGIVVVVIVLMVIMERSNLKIPDAYVVECLMVSCRHHDGEFMNCLLREVEIGSDGLCSRYEKLSDEELLNKCRGKISNA
ncbi:MAG: hypothetical protein C4542_07990 [Dehalococcoidia bacterium]|nr:MAG: hypothetical protein C4542_07990 [Dehalococcoidia bacterium]